MHYPGLQALARGWCRKVMLMGEERRGEEKRDRFFTQEEGNCTERGWMDEEVSWEDGGGPVPSRLASQCPIHLVKFFQVQSAKSWRETGWK